MGDIGLKAEVLRLLRTTDGYVSGQEMCDRFTVSRTAVWKVMNQLKEEGYRIQAVRNKGYCLFGVPDSMSQAELASGMGTEWAGRPLHYLATTDSTNLHARRLGEEGAPHGTLVVADAQEAGRGRRGRGWVSMPGEGVFMSILLRPGMTPPHASMLTLVAALGVAEGIRRAAGLACQIKWPNDLVIGQKKVCGILTEMQAEMDSIHYVVVGIGINVNTKGFPQELGHAATSLYLEGGSDVSRNRLVWEVMGAFEAYYGIFMETQDMSRLRDGYQSLLVNMGRDVRVESPTDGFVGRCLGIDQEGGLLVRTADGDVRSVVSGEVSVRGIYGYVDG